MTNKKNNGSISISDAVTWQDNLKKEIDFDKPDNELTPEEMAKKMLYFAMDKELEKSLGSEMKKDIDDKRAKMEALSKFQNNLTKLVEVGKEIEKNFILQGAYLINHFDKTKENHFKVVVDGMTTDVVNTNNSMSNSERERFANKILEIIKVYRGKVLNELHAKHEILLALIPSLEKTLSQADFDLLGKEVGDKESADRMKEQFSKWLNLSKELIRNRKKAIEAVEEDLETEEILPRFVIQNNGDITKNVSVMELKTRGERMVRLVSQADASEKEIEEERSKISEELFGKAETYMEFQKENEAKEKPVLSGGMGTKTKWFIVITLSIVALSWGIWTSIGVFVLGFIIINVLKN